MSIALYRVFKVQRLETDPGGGTPYAEQPPQYVEADNIKVIRDYLNKLPKGFYRWDIEEIKVGHFSRIHL